MNDATEWESKRRLHRADVRWAERQLGRLGDLLSELGQVEDSVLVVISDHGEDLGRHGIAGAEVDTRLHSPGLLEPRRGRARTRPLLAEYAPPAPGLVRALVRRNPELDLTRLRRGYRTTRVGDHRLTLASDGRVELDAETAERLRALGYYR